MILPMNIAHKLREGDAVILCGRCQWSDSFRIPRALPASARRQLEGLCNQPCPQCGARGLDRVEPDGDSPTPAVK